MPPCDECFEVRRLRQICLIVVPMSRIISHQPGLGTPDEVLGDGDGTDSGVGEKRLRGMGIGLAEIGAQKYRGGLPKEVGAPETGIRRKRPSDAPGQRPQSLVLEAELNRHGNI